MPKTDIVRRLKIRAGKRALKILADQAIGHDLLKGLIELITNCDESYARLEDKGERPGGRIEVEVDRRPRKKQTVIRVIDWAQGMDESQMEKCVGGYGEDTSGQVGRGVFGMGLKDTINAFGEGTIISFQNARKFACTLHDVEELDIKPPCPISTSDRREFRNVSGGTVVEIVVHNPKVRIPFVDSLRQDVQKHVCLRGIMTDLTRKVILRDLRGGSADELRYQPPEGEIMVDGRELSLPSYPQLKPRLTIKRAIGPEALSQSGSGRTGGIVIISRRTYHEATLFGYDEDPHASRLFGELRCDEIYDMQAAGETIVDKNRNGLQKNHPLTKELLEAARSVVEEIIEAEKAREKQERQTLEREETAKRFREAVRHLNDMAKRELQKGGPGQGPHDSLLPPGEPRSPQDGLEFIPDTYRIMVAERESLKLRVQVDGATGIAVGDKVELSCDNDYIVLQDNALPKLFHEDPPLSTIHINIEGLQANAQGFVTAKHKGKTAVAAVEVVSTKQQKQHHSSSGLFKGIKYEERPDLPRRARFERKEGLIFVNTAGPSVDLYFGPGGQRQELPANQVMVAELVTELACQEIARVKRETKTLDIPPGVDELEAFFQHTDKLKADYAPVIHKILVNSEYRKD